MRLTTLFAVIALLISCGAPAYADTLIPKATLTAASKTNAYDAINHVVDKASEGIAATAHLVQAQLPKALELAVHGVYARGAASIAIGLMCLATLFFFLIMSITAVFAAVKADNVNNESKTIACVIIAVISGLLCIPFLIATCINLLDSDSWARVISPDGYLAQAILTKALGQ